MVARPTTLSTGLQVFNIRDLKGWQTAIESGDIASAVMDADDIATDLGVPLYIPDQTPGTGTYATKNLPFNSTITLNYDGKGLITDMNDAMTYTGSANEAAIVCGDEAQVYSPTIFHCWVKRNTVSWSNEAIIGIQFINLYRAQDVRFSAERFTIGVQFLGSGSQGCAYSKDIKPWLMRDNKIALDLHRKRRVSDSTQGWVNENLFIGGQFSTSSTIYAELGSPSTTTPVGIRFSRYDSNSTFPQDKNVFTDQSFEIDHNFPAGAYPWLIECAATDNRVDRARYELEVYTNPVIRITAASGVYNNTFYAQYHNNATAVADASMVDDQGSNIGNRVYTQRASMANQPATSGNIGEGFARRLTLYKKTGEISIPGWGWYTNGVSGQQPASYFKEHSATSGYLKIAANSFEGPCRRFRTTHCKEFAIHQDYVSGYSGRIFVQCLDSSGNILGGTYSGRKASSTGPWYAFGAAMTWSTAFGGMFWTQANFQRAIIQLHEDVAEVIAGVTQNGGTEARIYGCNIYGIDGFLQETTPNPIDYHKQIAYEWPENRNATATCTVSAGAINAVTITQAGGCYSSAPGITITGGGGSGAILTASVSSLSSGGSVTSIAITNGGTGYTSAPTLTIAESTDKTQISKGMFVYNANFAGNIADTAAWIYTTTGQYDSVDSTAL